MTMGLTLFQQFMTNKERGFKRTSPAVSAAPNKPKSSEIKCEACGYIASNKQAFSDHIIRVHKITRRTDMRTEPTEVKEQKKILYCHYWNNGGSCKFLAQVSSQVLEYGMFREQIKGSYPPTPGPTGGFD